MLMLFIIFSPTKLRVFLLTTKFLCCIVLICRYKKTIGLRTKSQTYVKFIY